VNKLEERK